MMVKLKNNQDGFKLIPSKKWIQVYYLKTKLWNQIRFHTNWCTSLAQTKSEKNKQLRAQITVEEQVFARIPFYCLKFSKPQWALLANYRQTCELLELVKLQLSSGRIGQGQVVTIVAIVLKSENQL